MMTVKVHLEDLSGIEGMAGGYGVPDEELIVINNRLEPWEQKLTVIHEVIELHLEDFIEHELIDTISYDIYSCLEQLK